MSSQHDSAPGVSGVPVAESTRRVIARYLFVGVLSAGFELAAFQILFLLTAHSVAIANPIAVTAATLLNFALNRTWAFRSRSGVVRSALAYLALFVFNTTFSTLTITWLAASGWLPIIAKVVTMGCITAWNFVLYRKVVFR